MYRSFTTTTTAAALLAFLPHTLAVGTAYVVSNCDFDVYYASVSQNVGAPMQLLPAGGYSEQYDKPNDGISIKISTSPSGPVTQFEFTWDSPNINYDISHINGNPFEAYGSSLVPSEVGAAGYPTCVALSCPAGTSFCTDAYNQPDDIQTRVCPDSSDLTFTLCPGGSSGNAPSVSSAKGSGAASSIVVSSVVASQPAFSQPGFSQPSVAASSASQPAFTQPSVSQPAYSQPTYSRPAFSQPAVNSQPAYSQPGFQRTSAVASSPAAPVPTSFQTYTTSGRFQAAVSSVQVQGQAQNQNQNQNQNPAVTVTNPVLNSEVDVPNTPSTAAPAPAATHSWSWGNWDHGHRRRAHSHRFRI